MKFCVENMGGASFVHFEIVPSLFHPRLREWAGRFLPGGLRLEAGIQTLDPVVAATIGRRSDPAAELETIGWLKANTRAIVHADLIVGLPGETLEGFARGFDRLLAAGPDEIQVGMLKRLPGAPLARHDLPFGMRYGTEPPYEIEASSTMDESEIARLRNFARFWEVIVNRGNFPEVAAVFARRGAGAFDSFLALADALLARFGRNWGIARAELAAALEDLVPRG